MPICDNFQSGKLLFHAPIGALVNILIFYSFLMQGIEDALSSLLKDVKKIESEQQLMEEQINRSAWVKAWLTRRRRLWRHVLILVKIFVKNNSFSLSHQFFAWLTSDGQVLRQARTIIIEKGHDKQVFNYNLSLCYRVFIKHCVFSKILKYILDSDLFRFPLGVSRCTQWQVKHRHCSRTCRVNKNHNILRKTQYLMNTLYMLIQL